MCLCTVSSQFLIKKDSTAIKSKNDIRWVSNDSAYSLVPDQLMTNIGIIRDCTDTNMNNSRQVHGACRQVAAAQPPAHASGTPVLG